MAQLPFIADAAHSVAIIGAGAGGSAAAYHLHQLSPNTSITVFERANYIGGRSTTVDVLGQPIELGASIFVDVNVNLMTAAKLLNLTLVDPDAILTRAQNSLGIWNGKDFVYRDTGGSKFLNLAKLVWRYGLSPYRAQRHVSNVIDRFLNLYKVLPFSSLSVAAERFDLLPIINQTTRQAYAEAGVSESFIEEIINAATRVNYAQDVSSLHGLMGAVAFVTDDAKAVQGGNWRIFKGMLDHSGAQVKLQTQVQDLVEHDGSWRVCDAARCETFDEVVLAAPWEQSGISVTGKHEISILPVEYVELHVTLVATKSMPSRAFFKDENVPAAILTTTNPENNQGVREPDFFSFSVVGNAADVAIYKIFSRQKLDKQKISELFDGDLEPDVVILEKLWHSYPIGQRTADFDDWEVAPGLWYLNGMERFISTMETATLAGRNVAGLIHQRLIKKAS